jgi:gallate dioxygenase
VYESEVAVDPALNAPRQRLHRQHMAHQTRGAEELEGTYPFTLQRSVDHYRINKLPAPADRPGLPRALPGRSRATYEEAGLTPEERDMITRRDWQAMIRYGVIFFLLEKLGAVVGVSNLHIYAAMRGQSLEDFQKTRNTKALYSVAGKGAADTADWNKDGAGS